MTFALNPHLDTPTETPHPPGLDLSIPDHPDLPEISTSISESVLFGGKRLRPMVCFLAGRFFGIDSRIVHPFARAAELTHAATLCHDDVIDMADNTSFDLDRDYSELAARYDAVVLRGVEVETTIGHVLVFGVTPEFLSKFDLTSVSLP